MEEKRYKRSIRIFLARYRTYRPCPECGGTRLRPETRWARIGDVSLPDLMRWPVQRVLDWITRLDVSPADRQVLHRVLEELHRRLWYLTEVGLGYLTLDRQAGTLSGGEAQRIQMAIALGTALSDVLFILDEPSAGLHPRDTDRLVGILRQLRDQGNTVVVVEHDPDIIARADYVIELGPDAGESGGEVVFTGAPEQLRAADTPTGRYLRRAMEGYARVRPERVPSGWIEVTGARAHNLRHLHVRIPVGCMTVITGVSGSGKSSLLVDVLYPALRDRLGRPVARMRRTWTNVQLDPRIRDVVYVDQNPPSRNPRATVLSYLGGLTELRNWFVRVTGARARGLEPGDFSWNTVRGRCPTCRGLGQVRIEMRFLSDLWLQCETCAGRRLREEVLAVRWNDWSFADLLDLTARQLETILRDEVGVSTVRRICRVLTELGLGYLRMSQPLSTLSGGEAQRLKLIRMLARPNTEPTVFLLDEPTIGLHGEDIARLLAALERLLEQGHTVVVVEHHPEVILNADYMIDLGPEGGDAGGRIVAEGPVLSLIEDSALETHTLRYLRAVFAGVREIRR